MEGEVPKSLRSTMGKLHLPLLEEMLRHSGHPDVDLPKALREGFPFTGTLHMGGVGRGRPGGVRGHGKPANGWRPDLEELRSKCQVINEETLRRAHAARADPEGSEKVWEKSRRRARRVS